MSSSFFTCLAPGQHCIASPAKHRTALHFKRIVQYRTELNNAAPYSTAQHHSTQPRVTLHSIPPSRAGVYSLHASPPCTPGTSVFVVHNAVSAPAPPGRTTTTTRSRQPLHTASHLSLTRPGRWHAHLPTASCAIPRVLPVTPHTWWDQPGCVLKFTNR